MSYLNFFKRFTAGGSSLDTAAGTGCFEKDAGITVVSIPARFSFLLLSADPLRS